MKRLTDQQLLKDYAGHRSERAFAELVQRHVDLVYSAALRMVRDVHLAEDVTQGVFVALAGSARQLSDRPVLSGWLHRTAQNLAANTVRADVRRRTRESDAATMNELLAAATDTSWEDIAAQLDAALGELSEADRDALLLRYFERKSASEMAQILGLSNEAAQKRVHRALERLRGYFSRGKITVATSGLAVLISAHAVHSAPVGLASAISAAAMLAGTAVQNATVIAATKTIAMTILQKTLIISALAAAVGTAIYEIRQADTLGRQVQSLQAQQTPLAEQLTRLQTENAGLSNQIRQAGGPSALTTAELSELLKLRGQVAPAQANSRELAALKATLARQAVNTPDFLSNAMTAGAGFTEQYKLKAAQARLAHMKTALNLSDEQAQAINAIMQKYIRLQTQATLDTMTGKSTAEQLQAARADQSHQQVEEIKTLLTPDQRAAYPAYLQAEAASVADTANQTEARQIASDFALSDDQATQVYASLSQAHFNDPQGFTTAYTNALKNGGNIADAASLIIQMQTSLLDQKLKILGGILTPEQINTYRQQQLDLLNLQANALKSILPPKTSAAAN